MARERQPQPTSAGLRAWLAARFRASWADYAWSLDLPADGDAGDWVSRAEALEAGQPVVVAFWELPQDTRRQVREQLGNPAWVRIGRDGTCTAHTRDIASKETRP